MNCQYNIHPDSTNNGGLFCCKTCKRSKIGRHGPACKKISYESKKNTTFAQTTVAKTTVAPADTTVAQTTAAQTTAAQTTVTSAETTAAQTTVASAETTTTTQAATTL